MSQAPESRDVAPEITKTLAEYTTGISFDDLSTEAVEASKHCLLDWIGVTIAGLEEPLTKMLIAQAEADGGEARKVARVKGGGGGRRVGGGDVCRDEEEVEKGGRRVGGEREGGGLRERVKTIDD